MDAGEDYLAVKNYVTELVLDEGLSLDNFQTVVAELFINQITDDALAQFLRAQLRGQQFVSLERLVDLVYQQVTCESVDEKAYQGAVRQRNAALVRRYEARRELHALCGEVAQLGAQLQRLEGDCQAQQQVSQQRMLAGLQQQLSLQLQRQKQQVADMLQQAAPRGTQRLSLMQLRASQARQQRTVREEVAQLSEQLAQMARATHQNQIFVFSDLGDSLQPLEVQIQQQNAQISALARRLASDTITGRLIVLAAVAVTVIAMAVCVVHYAGGG